MEDQNKTEGLFNLSLDPEAKSSLRTTAIWARIIAIIAFVQAGVGLVTSFTGGSSAAQIAGAVFASILGVAISVLLNIFLFRFAQKTGNALTSSNQESFVEGINSLRNYFKIYGILIIIGLSLMAILMLFFFISLGMAGGAN